MSKTKSTSLLNRSQRTTESSSSSKNQSKQQPSTSSTTSPSIVKRKNRKNITLGLKLEIIKRLENGESNSSICHEYNLPSSTVSTIRSKKEQIKAFCKNDDGDGTLKNQYYQITYPRNNIVDELELLLYNWLKDHNYSLNNVRYQQIRDKSIKIFEDLKRQHEMMDNHGGGGIDINNNNNEQQTMITTFKPSHSWFERFRKRFCEINNPIPNLSSMMNGGGGNNDQSLLMKNSSWHQQLSSQTSMINNGNNNGIHHHSHHHDNNNIPMMLDHDDHPTSINEPITVIEEEYDSDDDDNNDDHNHNHNNGIMNQSTIMSKNNFENDIMELFWGKLVTSIFLNEKVNNGNSNNNNNTGASNQESIDRLDAQSLAIVFKLSEAIINIVESRDNNRKRFLGFKQNLAHILHPYREIYNQKLSTIRDSLKYLHQQQQQQQQQHYHHHQNKHRPTTSSSSSLLFDGNVHDDDELIG